MTDRTAPAKEAEAEPLKSCPFCGEAPAMMTSLNKKKYGLMCGLAACGMRGPHWLSSRDEAIAAWNRRSSPVREGDLGQATPSAPHPSRLYRKKPVVVEAVQFGGDYGDDTLPDWWSVACSRGEHVGGLSTSRNGLQLLVFTLEGMMRADRGDWVVRGIKGELHPVRADIFAETYEAVIEPTNEMGASGAEGDQASPSSADLSRGSDVPSALSDEFIQQCIDTGSMTREVRLIALREIQNRRLAFSALHKALPDLGNMIQSRLSANRDGPLSSDERSNLSDFLAVLRAPASPSEPSGRGEPDFAGRVQDVIAAVAYGTSSSDRDATPKELDELADIIDGEVGDARPHHMERAVWAFVSRSLKSPPTVG